MTLQIKYTKNPNKYPTLFRDVRKLDVYESYISIRTMWNMESFNIPKVLIRELRSV